MYKMVFAFCLSFARMDFYSLTLGNAHSIKLGLCAHLSARPPWTYVRCTETLFSTITTPAPSRIAAFDRWSFVAVAFRFRFATTNEASIDRHSASVFTRFLLLRMFWIDLQVNWRRLNSLGRFGSLERALNRRHFTQSPECSWFRSHKLKRMQWNLGFSSLSKGLFHPHLL